MESICCVSVMGDIEGSDKGVWLRAEGKGANSMVLAGKS